MYVYRCAYAAALAALMITAWLILAGGQLIRSPGDMARFGAILFQQILAPLQLAVTFFFAALAAASAIAQEKDRRTLVLLLMTRMENHELVLGRLASALMHVVVMVVAGIPIMALATWFGGVSLEQIGRALIVTLAGATFAAAVGTFIAYWREKTVQTLAMTALALCLWLVLWEIVGRGLFGNRLAGISCEQWSIAFSPLRAIFEAVRPLETTRSLVSLTHDPVTWFVVNSFLLAFALAAWTTLRVRVWNPSREARVQVENSDDAPDTASDNTKSLLASEQPSVIQGGKETEVSSSVSVNSHRRSSSNSGRRRVWQNPVLWREVCTWAYGRKIWAMRIAYLVLFGLAAWTAHSMSLLGSPRSVASPEVIPAAAWPLAPLFLLSLVIINAVAVTSITTERDGKTLDLLLTTDLTPKEFVFGKLGGVFSVAGLMVVLPLGLVVSLWGRGELQSENLVFVALGLAVLNLFVATLGIHCGMRYSNSRTAVAVSLGTVFFLFLGVIACMLLMISFSGSFQVQLGPFLAMILGGGVGLYAALGARNPSTAIGVVSFLVPFLTFYAITSFLMRFNLSVFLVVTVTYGFTTAAMLVPALSDFDFSLDQGGQADD